MNKRMALILTIAGATATTAVVGTLGAAAATKPSAAAATPAASLMHVRAVLDSGHVVPHPATAGAGAAGLFTATWDGSILRYTFTFKKLSGPATSAQIRTGGVKASGPIAQPLCVPCFSPETGVVPLYTQQIAALKAGRLYVIVQTNADADGEIRGQLSLQK